MRNLKSILKRSEFCLALLAFAILASPSSAAPQTGTSVINANGQTIGTVATPMQATDRSESCVIINLYNGGQQIAPLSSLQSQGDSLVLTEFSAAPVSDPMLREIRSMTMVMIMESHEDAKLLTDIKAMNYVVQGDTLHIIGNLSSVNEVERLVNVTVDLCDYKIAPHILIRPQASS